MHGAPVSPREPPITKTLPEVNLVEPRRGGASRRARAADAARRGLDRARRRGCRCRRPRPRPRAPFRGGSTAPAWRGERRRDVRADRGAPTSPVEASIPLGTSAATTTGAAAPTAAIAPAARLARRAAKPVPSTASTIAAAPLAGRREARGRVARQPLAAARRRRRANSSGPARQQHVDAPARLAAAAARRPARRRRCCPCRTRSATRPSGARARDHAGEPLPRALHQLERRDPAVLDRPARRSRA